MNLKQVGNIVGLFIGLATVAIIAANPEFLKVTFTGVRGLLAQAEAPVTAKRK